MKISAYKDNRSKISILNKVGIFSASLLAVSSIVYLYSPVSGTHAETSADVNVSVSDVMALTISKNSINLDMMPYHFDSDYLTLTAATNSQYGYTLSLEDENSYATLEHSSGTGLNIYSSFDGSKTSSEMDDGTWGFSINGTDFYKVPRRGLPVALKRTNIPMETANETTDVTFGVKLGGDNQSGTYSGRVLFTMYVNGQDGNPENLSELEVPAENPTDPGAPLQDVCSNKRYVTASGNGFVMTDPRDGETYNVETLKDGHCWMTQNLRLIDKTISSEDSNLPSGETWTIPASSIEGFNSYGVNNAYLDDEYGGYYTFYTATAGWGTREATGNAPKDICPKGWMLPSGGYGADYNFIAGTASEMTTEGPMLKLGGRIQNGAFASKGTLGFTWASTVSTNTNYAYSAGISSTKFSPTGTSYKYSGVNVRCRAK